MDKIIVPPGSVVKIGRRGSRGPAIPPRKPLRTSHGRGGRQPNLIPFRNDSGETVPAFGVVKITGADRWEQDVYLIGDKPDTTFVRYYAINGRVDVPADEYGLCTMESIAEVLYDSGSPTYGEGWGAEPGEWTITKGRPGFTILGAVDSGRVLCEQASVVALLGKTDASHAEDASGTVSLWMGTQGSEADSTMNVTAYNRYHDLDSGVWVTLNWVGNGWDLVAGDCA